MTTNRRWMQAHDAAAARRRDDLECLVFAVLFVVILFAATLVPA